MEPHIFRSYDVRGIYGKDLNEEIMESIGNAFGSKIQNDCVVASDSRSSSPSLCKAFIKGVVDRGKNVVEITDVPLGVGMFMAWQHKKSYAYITASHLAKEWNGVKFFHSSGLGFMEDENFEIRDMVLKSPVPGKGKIKTIKQGRLEKINTNKAIEVYQNYLLRRFKAEKSLKVVLDCGNGMAGPVAPGMFKKAGFEVETVFEEVDCSFPNRAPEPTSESLSALSKKVRDSDIGIAYDGDGDRMVLADETGRILDSVQTSYMILKELLKTEKGSIVANVEASRVIDKAAKQFGRTVIRVPVGHTFLVEAVHKQKACFGLEVSGHYCIPSVVPYDDSLAISLFVAVLLSRSDRKLSDIVNELPVLVLKRTAASCPDNKKFGVVERLKHRLQEEYENTNTMDGVRVDFDDAWVLIRASNTASIIRLTIEAETEKRYEELRRKFHAILENEIRQSL
ncbi:MAG: hypothetical protein HZB66_00705 [Candidatus Aenigmarchaeota archaeon]|nr:hypothetical protein [Candidatus Aenigmarchaeota archaeon]